MDTDASDGIGRVPWANGKLKNIGQGISTWTESLWNTYRGESCFNGVCGAGENSANCPYDCGGLPSFEPSESYLQNVLDNIHDFIKELFGIRK